ncbi:acyltransferase [Peptostreptococcus equinus]|uniref:Acyltransferase n=1 Tax=Peptostreptococcus equinus TaxID=3003601 RepID=A0ABY7JLC5_9FIRM|nr:acyltransferase [Peptostreptococcus sp. CBA3647]WAW14154.1 acyltransferase [Peptostreptococcus sp. CBA3647]
MLKLVFNKLKVIMMKKDDFICFLRKQGVEIGYGCDIAKNFVIGDEPWLVKIGNNVRITQNVKFITHDGSIWTLRKMNLMDDKSVKYGNISVGDNTNIGWNVIVMPNIKIGKNCIIAAGAIVTKDIPDGEIWGGVPAKRIKSVYEFYKKNKEDVVPTFGMGNNEKREYLLKNRSDLFEF